MLDVTFSIKRNGSVNLNIRYDNGEVAFGSDNLETALVELATHTDILTVAQHATVSELLKKLKGGK